MPRKQKPAKPDPLAVPLDPNPLLERQRRQREARATRPPVDPAAHVSVAPEPPPMLPGESPEWVRGPPA
jgi:hypothetical protein